MPKVDEAYVEARRGEILDAALVSFARKGFLEGTIQDIARESGLSHGAIYRYFPSKDDIIEGVAARGRESTARRFAEAEKGVGPIAALQRMLRTYVELHAREDYEAEGRLRLEVLSAAPRNPRVRAALRDKWADPLDRVGDIVRRGQEHGEINPVLDPSAVARVITALHDGLYAHQTIERSLDTASCLEVIDALLDGTFHTNAEEGGGGDGPALRAEAE